MNRVFMILDDIFDVNEKQELVELQRKYDVTSFAILKSENIRSMIDLIMEASESADYIFFKNESILEQCQTDKSFIDKLLKQINKTGYFLDSKKFIGIKNTLPTINVVAFSKNQELRSAVYKLDDSVHMDIISNIKHDMNVDQFVQKITRSNPVYVIFDLDYIMDDFESSVSLLQTFKAQNQHIWIPQLGFDSRAVFALEVLDDIEASYHECNESLKPTMMS